MISEQSRVHRDVVGDHFKVRLTLINADVDSFLLSIPLPRPLYVVPPVPPSTSLGVAFAVSQIMFEIVDKRRSQRRDGHQQRYHVKVCAHVLLRMPSCPCLV